MAAFTKGETAGFVDQVIDNRIAGWAWSGPVFCKVEMWVDGRLVLTMAASMLRPDLVGVVCDDGRCGFVLSVPAALCDGQDRIIEVRFAGSERLLEFGRFEFCHQFVFPSPGILAKPDPALTSRAKSLLSLLRPVDVEDGTFCRRGRSNDGGYVMLDFGLRDCVAYSLGINDDVSWDLEMAADGARIYQYDHTIRCLPELHANFSWQRFGIAAQSGGEFRSIPDLIHENGHEHRGDLVLKIDIEGHEWDVFLKLPVENLRQFSQIVAEFHMLSMIDDDEHFRIVQTTLAKLNQTHRLVHLHANNCGELAMVGGVVFPDVLEVTYIRADEHRFSECRRTFPTPLDMPCNPNAADFYLGAAGQVP